MLVFKVDTWQEIYHSLRKNKLRTFLTLIGVGWGMFLFVSLLGAAKGMENGFNKVFENFATNGIVIWAQQTSIPYQGFPRGKSMDLRLNDAEYLKTNLPSIELVSPRNVTGRWGSPPSPTVYNDRSGDFTVYGDFPEAYEVSKKELMYGRLINDKDLNERRKVCMIGKQVYEQLFEPEQNPIGEFVKINNVYFKVIGVYKLPGDGGFEDDESIFIPFHTFQEMYNQGDKIGWMNILIKEGYDIDEAEKDIKSLLKEKNQVHPDDTQAYGGFNYGSQIAKVTGFIKGMKFLTIIVGILTIIAGVIAISNILLITVKERTKEIGIRRALGAKPGMVRGQILIESVFLTLLAGLLGFLAGVTLLFIINILTQNVEDFPFYNPTVDLGTVFLSLLVMVGLGLSIGLIPAQRAVMIKPIDALRSE